MSKPLDHTYNYYLVLYPPYDDGSHSYDGGVFDTVADAFEAGDTAMRRSDDAPGWFEVVVTRVGFTPDYNIRS